MVFTPTDQLRVVPKELRMHKYEQVAYLSYFRNLLLNLDITCQEALLLCNLFISDQLENSIWHLYNSKQPSVKVSNYNYFDRLM